MLYATCPGSANKLNFFIKANNFGPASPIQQNGNAMNVTKKIGPIKPLSISTSKFEYNGFKLALVYTAGHIIIAMTVVGITTGSTLWESGVVAIVEPTINGIWFYILYKIWDRLKVE